MPLKDVDLKTFEAYKKAIRLDLPKLSSGTKFWIYRDVELPNAAGKKQKIPSFIALVDNQAIKPLMHGKALICKGTCGIEGGKVAFEAESGQVPYRLLKTSVPLLLGKMVHIPSGKDEDSDGDDAEEKKSESKAEVKPDERKAGEAATAALAAEWNKLVKDMQAAVAAHPERKEGLSRMAAGIPELIKNNRAGEAKQRIDAVRKLVDAPAPSGPAPGSAELTTRWNTLVKQMQAAIAAQPDKKADLVRASTGIPDMIRTGKLDLARKLMDSVDELLKVDPRQKQYKDRYAAIDEELARALKNPARDASRLRAVSASAAEKAAAGDYSSALKALDQLKTLLDQPTEEQAEGTGAPSEGLVKYRRALFEFAKAKDLVSKQIGALKKAIPATLPDEAGLAEEIASELMSWNEDLSEVINDAINASEDEDEPTSDSIRTAIATYLNDLGESALVKQADKNTFDVSVSIAATLGNALRKIQQAMPAHA